MTDLAAVADELAAKRRQLVDQLAEMSAPPQELGSISFGKRVGAARR